MFIIGEFFWRKFIRDKGIIITLLFYIFAYSYHLSPLKNFFIDVNNIALKLTSVKWMSTLPGVWIQSPLLSKIATTDVLGAQKTNKLLIIKWWAIQDLNL